MNLELWLTALLNLFFNPPSLPLNVRRSVFSRAEQSVVSERAIPILHLQNVGRHDLVSIAGISTKDELHRRLRPGDETENVRVMKM
jgi:hypothetical protein